MKPSEWQVLDSAGASPADGDGAGISMHDLASALHGALAGSPACLVRVPLGWDGTDLEAGHPLDYLGMDGGAGYRLRAGNGGGRRARA